MHMTRTGLIAALLLVVFGPASAAGIATRHTQFLPFGQKMVAIELPKGLCFLDATNPLESPYVETMKAAALRNGGLQVKAFFTTCETVDTMNTPGGYIGPSGPSVRGTVSWLDPKVAHEVDLSRTDYLNAQEAAFPAYVRARLHDGVVLPPEDPADSGTTTEGLTEEGTIDELPRRTDAGIALAYTMPLRVNFEKQEGSGIIATTLLRGRPVEVTLSYTAPLRADATEQRKTRDELYAMMDVFLQQQVTLNAFDEKQQER
jgi:hypothetical protein